MVFTCSLFQFNLAQSWLKTQTYLNTSLLTLTSTCLEWSCQGSNKLLVDYKSSVLIDHAAVQVCKVITLIPGRCLVLYGFDQNFLKSTLSSLTRDDTFHLQNRREKVKRLRLVLNPNPGKCVTRAIFIPEL